MVFGVLGLRQQGDSLEISELPFSDSTKGGQGQMLVQLVDMTKLNIEHPTLLAQHTQQYIHQHTTEGICNPPFTCEVLIVLGGNIVKSGDWYITTPYEEGTKKSFG